MALTKVSDAWIKFWNELEASIYGETKNGYSPAEICRRTMVKYKIIQIKPNKKSKK